MVGRGSGGTWWGGAPAADVEVVLVATEAGAWGCGRPAGKKVGVRGALEGRRWGCGGPGEEECGVGAPRKMVGAGAPAGKKVGDRGVRRLRGVLVFREEDGRDGHGVGLGVSRISPNIGRIRS